jgi:hypothetical protein
MKVEISRYEKAVESFAESTISLLFIHKGGESTCQSSAMIIAKGSWAAHLIVGNSRI